MSNQVYAPLLDVETLENLAEFIVNKGQLNMTHTKEDIARLILEYQGELMGCQGIDQQFIEVTFEEYEDAFTEKDKIWHEPLFWFTLMLFLGAVLGTVSGLKREWNAVPQQRQGQVR